MKLSQILQAVTPVKVTGSADPEIRHISEDSRDVRPGTLFFARTGHKSSGLQFVEDAVRKGAVALISEEPLDHPAVPVIQVDSIAEAESGIAHLFYGRPSGSVAVVGVTGTNGKTTFTYLLEAIAGRAAWRVGVIGTVNYRLPDAGHGLEILPAPNTTPNALKLHKLFHAFRERRADLVVMEVSSHALALGRVGDVEFDGAVFTNLSQDHLDFHVSLEQYFEAKAKLFTGLGKTAKGALAGRALPSGVGKFCIINVDDPWGKKLLPLCSVPALSYGVESGSAEVRAEDVALSAGGSRFKLQTPMGSAKVNLKLIGLHNVYNALAAAATAVSLHFPLSRIVEGLDSLESIPGRLEPVDCSQDFTVLVDYAHTEDALKNVLSSLRQFAKKRVLALFGCGGDRDRSKRPLMGAIASRLSDWVVVTSDNSRSEDPKKIALDVEVGIQREGRKNYEVILDREEAIRKILKMAEKDDIVLIAGKGHETYQIFADRTIHFDDREVVRKNLPARPGRSNPPF